MKRVLSLLIAIATVCSTGIIALATEGEVVSEAVTEETAVVSEYVAAPVVLEAQNEILFHAEINSTEKKERHFAFLLYACDGQTELGRKYINTKNWETSFNVKFSVPEYNIGEKFIIKLFSDNAELIYNGLSGKEAILETYVTSDEAGNIVYQTSFYGEIRPYDEKIVKIKVENNTINTDYRVFGNEIYVSEDFIKELNVSVTRNKDSWTLKSQTENFYMNFYKDNIYATRNSEGYNLNYPVYEENGKAFLPLYDIAVYFACSYSESGESERIISMKKSYYSKDTTKEKFVNSSGVSSRTNYLIWISKSTYTVNVFTGSKGNWHLYKSYPCALGAPRTPTIEGQFEYIERLNRWSYANYYCGPVMRFHNGYALHSTLIRYNGTPYDDRVGVNISLGCIRLHPADIQELVSFTPFKTRIYITAK